MMNSTQPFNNNLLYIIDVPEAMRPIVSFLAVGDDKNLEEQIIVKSRQAHILKYTPKDSKDRFADKAMLKRWLAKGHQMHWLLNADNDLAGIIWYRVKPYPKDVKATEAPAETFAIRLYEGYVGHHLSVPFMKFSLQTAVHIKQARGEKILDIWLQTTPDNIAAVASYSKFGYVEIYRNKDMVVMVMPAEEILKIARSSW